MIVSSVRKGSKADQAGIKGGTQAVQYGTFNPQTIYLGGDIITEINGIKISKLADYYSAIEDKVPGDVVTVTVYRNRKFEKLKVELEPSSNSANSNI